MMGVSSGCGLCPWSCSGKVGAYAYHTSFEALEEKNVIDPTIASILPRFDR